MMELLYSHVRKSFLMIEDGSEVGTVPFLYSDLDHNNNVLQVNDYNGYSFSVYYKKDVKELEFHPVYVIIENKERIGWMIPCSTLTTEDGVILATEHLNQYVFFSYCYLLSQEDIQTEILNGTNLDEILDSKYSDGCLLVVNNALMPEGITTKKLELSLARNGYYKEPSRYSNPKIRNTKNLNLSPAGEILKDDGAYIHPYIDDFLKYYVYHDNSFIRFLFLYQIEEVLMDLEIEQLLKDYLHLLQNNKPNYRKIESLLKDNTELKRLQSIENNAELKDSEVVKTLDDKCNKFLNSEKDTRKSHPESIYHVRNHIVHRFRVACGGETDVKEICDYLELYLYNLLICYKLPKVNR